MFKKILKVIAFFFLFVVVVIVGYLIFEKWQYLKEREEGSVYIRTVELERAENYLIIETPEGKKVVNENVGLSFLVPEGWNVELFSEGEDHQGVGLSSPDIEAGMAFPLTKGCTFGVSTERYIQEFPGQERRPHFIQRQINGEEEIINGPQQIINFGNRAALKTTRETSDGRAIFVEFPKDNKIFSFGTFILPAEDIRCRREFDNFLSSVIIK